MKTDTLIHKYKNKITEFESSSSFSLDQRNILDFDIEFNSSLKEQYNLAINKTNQVKMELAKFLQQEFSFYLFRHGSINTKETKLPTKTKTDNSTFLSKIYTIPEASISFSAEIVKYSVDKYKQDSPNLVYCHRNPGLISEDVLDSFVKSKIEVIINDSEFSFYKDFGFELMLISFIGWTKVRIIELEKVNMLLLEKCLTIMKSHELEPN
ncbi:MAG: hypothetical protein WBP41_13720 [Saprospiraceae bacterium]